MTMCENEGAGTREQGAGSGPPLPPQGMTGGACSLLPAPRSHSHLSPGT